MSSAAPRRRNARRAAKARAKDKVEHLRQERREHSRKRSEEKTDATPRGETKAKMPSRGLVSWIAGLPSEISWRILIALVAIFSSRDGSSRDGRSRLQNKVAWVGL
jgi:hypothetical protein